MDYQAALDRLSLISIEIIELPDASITKAQLAGLIYGFMGEPERARASYESARGVLEREVEIRPNDSRIHSSLGLVYAALRRREEAIREAKLGMEMMPVSEDALRGAQRIDDLASTYRFLGEYDAALDMMEYELSIPARMSASLMRIDPSWDPVRDYPRFEALMDSLPRPTE